MSKIEDIKNKNAKEIKKILIDSFESYAKNPEENQKRNFIKLLESAIITTKNVEDYQSVREWIKIAKNYTKEELLEGEIGFKPAQQLLKPNYFYYISNLGRALIVDISDGEIKKYHDNTTKETLFFEKNHLPKNCLKVNTNCSFLVIKNGYFIDTIPSTSTEYTINKSDGVHKFVAYDNTQEPCGADWLCDDKSKNFSRKLIYLKIYEKPIELHHINGNPSDNRRDNLIFLPKALHNELNGKNYCQDKRYDPPYNEK